MVIKLYYPVSSEISIVDGFLIRNERLIIPSALQKHVLEQIRTGHQGLGKCRERAILTVWWPGLSAELEDVVSKYQYCCMNQAQKTESMIPSPFLELP